MSYDAAVPLAASSPGEVQVNVIEDDVPSDVVRSSITAGAVTSASCS